MTKTKSEKNESIKKKSYTLSKVPERIGCKVNTKSRYYDVDAIQFYEINK